MANLILAMRVALAVVFFVSAASKIVTYAETTQAIRDFGLPATVVRPLARLLPVSEFAVSIGLLTSRFSRLAAAASLLLLVAFTSAIMLALARGRRPRCNCFGQIRSRPIGHRTVLRNILLAAAAVILVLRGEHDAGILSGISVGKDGALVAVAIVAATSLALLVVVGWLLIHVLTQQGRLLLRIEVLEGRVPAGPHAHGPDRSDAGLEPGAVAPDFTLPSTDGESVGLGQLLGSGLPVLLLFVDPGCGPCNSLLPEIASWRHRYGQFVTIAVVSSGDLAEHEQRARQHGHGPVLVQQGTRLMDDYQVSGTPASVAISPNGVLLEPVAMGAPAIRATLRRIGDGAPANGRIAANDHAVKRAR
jgi:uncharacterized membrane protein YphA (DoxX/SURF4 family)/peroxiredoxin